MADDATRDRVRALVRDVLSKAVPAAETQSSSKPPATSGRFVNPLPSASLSGNITRDDNLALAQLTYAPGGGRIQGVLRYTNVVDRFENVALVDATAPARALDRPDRLW